MQPVAVGVHLALRRAGLAATSACTMSVFITLREASDE